MFFFPSVIFFFCTSVLSEITGTFLSLPPFVPLTYLIVCFRNHIWSNSSPFFTTTLKTRIRIFSFLYLPPFTWTNYFFPWLSDQGRPLRLSSLKKDFFLEIQNTLLYFHTLHCIHIFTSAVKDYEDLIISSVSRKYEPV